MLEVDVNNKFSNTIEYLDFNKYLKISSGILFCLVVFIYLSQFFEYNNFIKIIDMVVSVIFVSSVTLAFVKSLALLKVVSLEEKGKYEIVKSKKIIGTIFLILMFVSGFFLVSIFNGYTNYHISSNVLGVFLMSIPILSIYSIFLKKR